MVLQIHLNRAATGGYPYPLGYVSLLNWYHPEAGDGGS
jgi:hypothetical protein